MKLFFSIALLVFLSSAMSQAQDFDFQVLKETYKGHNVHKPWLAKEALFKIAELEANEEIIMFLRDVYNEPPRIRRDPKYAEIRSPREMSGYAEAVLVMFGEEDIKDKLISEILYDDKGIRSNALQKVKMIQGDVGVELLSYFIGETRDAEINPLGPHDWGAVKELSKRIDNPPMKIDHARDYKSYENGGRTAWLKWRYENYGSIPGREELFTQFVTSNEKLPNVAPEIVEVAKEIAVVQPTHEAPAEVFVTVEPNEESVEQTSNWWLWLIGALVAVGGILIFRKRH